MVRRLSILSLGAVLLASAAGCRTCSRGWFTSASRDPAECQLVGRPGVMMEAPGAFVPGNGVPLMPGGAPGAELPFPQPTDLIPRTGVPVPPAVPSPAPGDLSGSMLPAPKFGVPVKGN